MSTRDDALGLHLHLVAFGPTLRFVAWFERSLEPDTFQRFKRSPSDVPFEHPAAFSGDEAPPGLPQGLHAQTVLVRVPRIGSLLPVPLPGLITHWDLANFKTQGRTHSESPYFVRAWVIPPELSLIPLRRWVDAWIERHGEGAVAPQTRAALDLIDTLHKSLRDGPLLPTLSLLADDWRAEDVPVDPTTRTDAAPLVWVPPWSLAEVQRLRETLAATSRIAASTDLLQPRDEFVTWTNETSPQRFAWFLIELLGAGAERGFSRWKLKNTSESTLRGIIASGELAKLHQAYGSCLHPHDALFHPAPIPQGHMHMALSPVDEGDARSSGWELRLGLHGEKREWLPLDALVRDGTLRHDVVAHGDAVWFKPASVLERDWNNLLADKRAVFLRRPELLARGRTRLDDAMAQQVLQQGAITVGLYEYRRWLDELGVEPPPETPARAQRARADFTALTAAPAIQGKVKVRLRWEMPHESARDEITPATARFVPELRVSVGDVELMAADVERMVRESSAGFVQVQGRAVARDEMTAALDLLRARERLLKRACDEKGVTWARAVEIEDEWAAERESAAIESSFSSRWEEFLRGLRDVEKIPQLKAPDAFKGSLRRYQERGLSWMSFLIDHGFGGCLADDMGLGKTVQVLATLAHRRAGRKVKRPPPTLVVCPTAVVINWSREARRFTPGLAVHVHQGHGRVRDEKAFRDTAAASDLVVTSYALVRRDHALFEGVNWDVVVADEAHNLKNPSALQTRVLKALPAQRRIALTGTPVENHLTDLWSIYDFAMPGLLGGSTRFARTFMTPLRNGEARAMERLQRRVGPFLLRRTKADPTVAADLPPKQEQDTWCDLTREQITLYRAMTEATLEEVADRKGIQRRAHILAALTRFKQICNHPENFQKDKPERLLGRSGKLDRLIELVEELVMESQATIIFTQFAEMGKIIQRAIYEQMSMEVDFYHGGVNPKEREEIVGWFNDASGPPVLIVSLRAGGSGLNLTRASAVIHYDRWWNPAVEDQATDRAHRIGQTRKVNVYKFVTRGTLEERIVNLLESKRELAEKVLASSDESWITEMSNQELRSFLALGETSEDADGD